MRKLICIAIFLSTIVACSRQGGKVVATVDGSKITAQALIDEMRMERGLYDAEALSSEANFQQFRKMVLERLILETILLREAKAAGVTISDEELSQDPAMQVSAQNLDNGENSLTERGIDPTIWRETQKRRAVIGKLIEKEVVEKIPVTDEQVADYYRKHTSDFRDNTQYHARQILVDSREEADKIHAKLMKGGDFAELAKQNSASPDGRRGGDLGYFDAQSFPDVFSEICQKLSIGEISPVQSTPYGYQIFQLLDKRPARQRPLSEVTPLIKRMLQEEKIESTYSPWIESLKTKVKISIDEQTLKEVSLEG